MKVLFKVELLHKETAIVLLQEQTLQIAQPPEKEVLFKNKK